MTNLAKALVGLAAAAFVLAVVGDFTMVHIGTTAEGWSSLGGHPKPAINGHLKTGHHG